MQEYSCALDKEYSRAFTGFERAICVCRGQRRQLDSPAMQQADDVLDSGQRSSGQRSAVQWSAVSDQKPAAAESRFLIDWVDLHRESTEPADPAYPDGSAIDVALDAPHACRLQLPCPAARCGQWLITCRDCRFYIALATAGRADDPKSVRLPCRLA